MKEQEYRNLIFRRFAYSWTPDHRRAQWTNIERIAQGDTDEYRRRNPMIRKRNRTSDVTRQQNNCVSNAVYLSQWDKLPVVDEWVFVDMSESM